MRLAIVHLAMAAAVATGGCNRSQPGSDGASSESSVTAAATKAAPTGGVAEPVAAGPMRRVFVANYGDDTLSVLEGAPHEMEVRTLTGFESPQALAIRPAEPRLLAVGDGTAFGITIIDPDTLEQKSYLDLGEAADELEFSADGKVLFVLHTGAGRINFVDADTLAVTGDPIEFLPRQPRYLAVEADGSRVFVLLVTAEAAEVTYFDPKTRVVEPKRIAVDIAPKVFALGNNGRSVVSASFDKSTLSVVDTRSLEVIATHPSPTGIGLVIHPTKPIAYTMASFDDEFHVVDIESGAVVKSISAGRFPTYPTLSPDARYLYIPHSDSDSVVKLDTESNEVVAKIAVGKEPIAVAVYQR